MTTQQLLALDLLMVVLAAVLFAAAGVITAVADAGGGRRRARAALVCAGMALLLTVGRVVVVALLAGRGWWFAGEKVLFGLPLAALPAAAVAVFAVPTLLRIAIGRAAAGPSPAAAAVLLAAAYAAIAGLPVAFVVGYPVSIGSAVVIMAMVLGLSGLTWVGLNRRRTPGLVAGLLLVCILPVLIAAATAFYRNIQPVLIGAGDAHGHAVGAAGGGDGVASGGMGGPATVSVADLRVTPDSTVPVRTFTLTARQEAVTLPSGRTVDAWTFGSLPGPEIRVTQGDLVEVTLHNRDIADGVTVHWHGYRVPAGDDGVAGVTQDAVLPGESFTYRFVAKDAGTYWYHAHQVSSEAVARGLLGALIVEPAAGSTPAVDLTLPVHTISGSTLIGASDLIERPIVPAGQQIRLRLINTDSVPQRISITGTAFTVTAADGTGLNAPPAVTGSVLRIPAGGRLVADYTAPENGVAVGVEGAPDLGVWLDPRGGPPVGPMFTDGPDLDLLGYGTSAAVPGMTDRPVDRDVTLVLDRQLRFLEGIPAFAQTVNGEVHPHVPPIDVREGELMRLTVVNRGSETHPMHPHGHRVLVLSRDGIPVGGSPLWLDTFDVRPGEVWEVLLLADNPGIWMAHCHNLDHATQGMVVHLVYDGVSTPFSLGGSAGNRPE
jgi:FtsP/CotA-like multicopper oxidase with cupredoxin domain